MGNDPANMIDPTGMKAQVGYGQEVNYMHDLYAPKDQGSGGGSGSQRYAEDWDYEMEWNLAMEWKEKQDKDKKGDNEPSTDGGDNGGIDVTGINSLGTLESALSSTPGMSATSANPMNGPLYASAGDGDGKSPSTASAIMTTTLAVGLATSELPPVSAGVIAVGGAIAGAVYLSGKLPSAGEMMMGMTTGIMGAIHYFAKDKKDYGTRGESEHKKNASKRTEPDHQHGQARKVRDRGGAKGMKNPPRNRPLGHKGKWKGHGG